MTDKQQKIAKRAYQRFEARGARHGSDLDDWLKAEKEVSAEEKKAGKAKKTGDRKKKAKAKT